MAKKSRPEPTTTRRNLFLAAGGTILGLTGLAALVSSPVQPPQHNPPTTRHNLTNQSLEMARAHPELRQGFLELFLAENPIPHCSGIHYDPNLADSATYNQRMATKYHIPYFPTTQKWATAATVGGGAIQVVGRENNRPIFVSADFFDGTLPRANGAGNHHIIEDIEHVKSLLLDHEGQHVTDMVNGYRIGDQTLNHATFPGPLYYADFIDALKEARAYVSQLRNITRRNISRYLFTNTKTNGVQHIANLAFFQNFPEDLTVEKLARAQIAQWPDITITPQGDKRYHISFNFLPSEVTFSYAD